MRIDGRRGFAQGTLAGMLLLGVMLAAGWLSGCGETDDAGRAGQLFTPETGGSDLAALLPTMDEVDATLALSAEQREQLKDALSDFRTTMHERIGDLQRGRRSDDWQAGRGRPDMEGATMALLTEAAAVLDQEQLLKLIGLLTERQERISERLDAMCERLGQMRGRHGHRRSGGEGPQEKRLEELTEALGLTSEQRSAVEALFEERREAMRELHETLGEDATREEIRAQMASLREEYRDRLAEILTPEQQAQLEEMRNERHREAIERRLAGLEEQFAHRLEFLTILLELNAEQIAQAETILADARSQITAVLQEQLDGTLDWSDAHEAVREIREASMIALRGLLTEEQAEILDALHGLREATPQRRGHGPLH